MPLDPAQASANADAAIRQAAEQLRAQLDALAREIDPFPVFPGSMFSYGIEVPSPPGADRGCVVLGEDGGLYELQIGMDTDQLALGVADPASTRQELRVPLDGLAPIDYVSYAYRAIQAVVAYLEQQRAH